MATIKTFRDLIAWQRGMELARAIYRATERMPRNEQFGLTNQARRASASVPSNIAEGYGRHSTADYLRSLRMARGSLYEVATQYELAVSLKMIDLDPQVHDLIAEEDRILQGLIRSLENKIAAARDS